MSPAKAAAPTLDVERQLALAGARYVAGMDEVGRGALAGPASVGVVVVDTARWLGSGDDGSHDGDAVTGYVWRREVHGYQVEVGGAKPLHGVGNRLGRCRF